MGFGSIWSLMHKHNRNGPYRMEIISILVLNVINTMEMVLNIFPKVINLVIRHTSKDNRFINNNYT